VAGTHRGSRDILCPRTGLSLGAIEDTGTQDSLRTLRTPRAQFLDHPDAQVNAQRLLKIDIRYSTLVKIADDADWGKKSYNNAISVLRRAFKFGYRDHPEQHDPTLNLKGARIRKQDRRVVDPFTIQEAEALIAAIHRDWGEAQGNYDEFRMRRGPRARPTPTFRRSSARWHRKHQRHQSALAAQIGSGQDRHPWLEHRPHGAPRPAWSPASQSHGQHHSPLDLPLTTGRGELSARKGGCYLAEREGLFGPAGLTPSGPPFGC
jgi:hypothetical protein